MISGAGLFSRAPAVASNGTLSFTPAVVASGTASVSVTLADDGSAVAPNVNTSASRTFTIAVSAVNDAPTFAVPGAQSVNEGASLTLRAAISNRIRVADLDSGASNITVTVSTTHGTITVSSAGVAVSDNTSHAVSITGTATNINTALDGLAYAPGARYSGPDTIALHADDGGNTGSGGSLNARAFNEP